MSSPDMFQWEATFPFDPIVCRYFSPSGSKFIVKIWTSWTELVFYSCIESLLYSAVCGLVFLCNILFHLMFT